MSNIGPQRESFGVEWKGDPLLDIAPWTGIQRATFRWRLCTAGALSPQGDLRPFRESPPTMSFDSNRVIQRQISDVILPAHELADINLLSDRVCVDMELEDGRRFPLGVFMFLTNTKPVTSRPVPLTTLLVDENFLLDKKTRNTFSVPSQGFITEALKQVMSMAGFTAGDLDIIQSDVRAGDHMGWPAGASKAQIAAELCDLIACYPPYLNRDGVMIVRQVTELSFSPAIQYLPVDSRVFADDSQVTDTLAEAPNIFVIVNNGNTAEEIAGVYRVPAEAPHSIENRGFEFPETIPMQGIGTTDQATQIARARAFRSAGDFRSIELVTPADPRHDGFDIVLWDGELWLEGGWSMQLRPGGEMRHQLRKIYQD